MYGESVPGDCSQHIEMYSNVKKKLSKDLNQKSLTYTSWSKYSEHSIQATIFVLSSLGTCQRLFPKPAHLTGVKSQILDMILVAPSILTLIKP